MAWLRKFWFSCSVCALLGMMFPGQIATYTPIQAECCTSHSGASGSECCDEHLPSSHEKPCSEGTCCHAGVQMSTIVFILPESYLLTPVKITGDQLYFTYTEPFMASPLSEVWQPPKIM